MIYARSDDLTVQLVVHEGKYENEGADASDRNRIEAT